MKKVRIVLMLSMICVMLFGSVITTHAAEGGYIVDRYGFTTDTGQVYDFRTMKKSTGYEGAFNSFYVSEFDNYTECTIVKFGNVYECIYYPEGDKLYYDPLLENGNYMPRLGKADSNRYVFEIDQFGELFPYGTLGYSGNIAYYDGYDLTTIEGSMLAYKPYVVYSTQDIYTNATCKSVFYKAPKSVLAPVVQKIQMTGALAEVKTMIPICLACLVGWIALRKGLALLQRILKTA